VDDAPETDTTMEGDLGKDEMRAGLPVLAFADACAFDNWLESHGPLAPGLWLRLAKKGAPERTLTKSEAIDAALCHGWIDGQLNTFDDHTWLTRFTPRKPAKQWSKLNRTRGTLGRSEDPRRARRSRHGARGPKARQRRPSLGQGVFREHR
jgi:hypothetical protein